MGKKKKKKNRTKPQLAAPTTPNAAMGMDSILAQLASLADNSRSSIMGKPEDEEFDAIWKANIEALEQTTAILSALQDEGIRDPEQVHDLIADYNALADERRELHRKYEHPNPAISVGGQDFCPECRNPIRYQSRHCPRCGKRLDNGVEPKRRKV